MTAPESTRPAGQAEPSDAAAAATRQAAAAGLLAAEHLARAVALARAAGLVVDDELYQHQAVIASWAAWLAGRAQQEGP